MFGVVLAVEPPALAGKKNGTRKSEPATSLVSFLISPLKRFQLLSNRNKKNVNKNNRKLHEEILRQIEKYSHGRKGKKWRQNPLIKKMILAEYANIF